MAAAPFPSGRRRKGGFLGSYRDPLGLVLLLLWLQGELYEELLQLFIAIINTKLLKAAKKNQGKKSLFAQKEVQTVGAAENIDRENQEK